MPIFVTAWFVGSWVGITVSVVSIGTEVSVESIVLGSHIHGFILYWNEGIRIGFFLMLVLLLSAFQKALEREQSVARSDFLTGVADVRSFYEVPGQEIEGARRYSRLVALVYFVTLTILRFSIIVLGTALAIPLCPR